MVEAIISERVIDNYHIFINIKYHMVEAIISEILDPFKLKFLIDNYHIFINIKFHMVEAIISEILGPF